MRKPSIQRIQKSEKGGRANHQLYLVWCNGVRLYAGSEVCRDDDTASAALTYAAPSVTDQPNKSCKRRSGEGWQIAGREPRRRINFLALN